MEEKHHNKWEWLFSQQKHPPIYTATPNININKWHHKKIYFYLKPPVSWHFWQLYDSCLTLLTTVWQLLDNSDNWQLTAVIKLLSYLTAVIKPLSHLTAVIKTLVPSDSCQEKSCSHQSHQSDLDYCLTICGKNSLSNLEDQSVYIPPPFRSNWSGHSSIPLFSYHYSTLLYPLLGTEEAQQCRKIASHCLSLNHPFRVCVCLSLLHYIMPFFLIPFVLCPSLWETFSLPLL